MEFITEVNPCLAFLSSKLRPVLPWGVMGNEPRNIPVIETEDAVRLQGGVTMETHMEESRQVFIYLVYLVSTHIHTLSESCR